MIAGLAKVAWADGKLLPREAGFFAEVIDGLELDAEARALAWRSIVIPPAETDIFSDASLTPEDHRQVLALSYAMVKIDGDISDEELSAIRALGAAFGMSWKDVLELVGHPLPW
jgi:tellurite resistance protein